MIFESKLPIYVQIMDDMKLKILDGEYLAGEKLLSVRDLGTKYKVNPNTIQRVYQELETLGIIRVERGLGTFVTNDEEVIEKLRLEKAEEVVNTFVAHIRKLGLDREEILKLINENIKRGDLIE